MTAAVLGPAVPPLVVRIGTGAATMVDAIDGTALAETAGGAVGRTVVTGVATVADDFPLDPTVVHAPPIDTTGAA